MEAQLERLDQIHHDLAGRAFLYDDPIVYREAIDAALEAMRALFDVSAQARAEVG